MWKGHRCYGYVINGIIRTESEMSISLMLKKKNKFLYSC